MLVLHISNNHDVYGYVGKLPEQYFNMWLFSNPRDKILIIVEIFEARISEWNLSVYCEVLNLKYTVYYVKCALCSAQFSVRSMQCAVCTGQCAVCSVQCTVFIVLAGVFSIHRKKCNEYRSGDHSQCSVSGEFCIVWSV